MANISKRVNKKLAQYLQNGEIIESAFLFEPKGTYSLGGMSAAALATRTTGKHLEKKATHEHELSGGVATQTPSRSFVFAITQKANTVLRI